MVIFNYVGCCMYVLSQISRDALHYSTQNNLRRVHSPWPRCFSTCLAVSVDVLSPALGKGLSSLVCPVAHTYPQRPCCSTSPAPVVFSKSHPLPSLGEAGLSLFWQCVCVCGGGHSGLVSVLTLAYVFELLATLICIKEKKNSPTKVYINM